MVEFLLREVALFFLLFDVLLGATCIVPFTLVLLIIFPQFAYENKNLNEKLIPIQTLSINLQ